METAECDQRLDEKAMKKCELIVVKDKTSGGSWFCRAAAGRKVFKVMSNGEEVAVTRESMRGTKM